MYRTGPHASGCPVTWGSRPTVTKYGHRRDRSPLQRPKEACSLPLHNYMHCIYSEKGFLPAKGHCNMTNFPLGFRLTSWILCESYFLTHLEQQDNLLLTPSIRGTRWLSPRALLFIFAQSLNSLNIIALVIGPIELKPTAFERE
jgi:hypothetical protein